VIALAAPFPEWALPTAFAWASGRLRQFADDFFPQTPAEFVEYSRRWFYTLGIWQDSTLSGAIVFDRASEVVAIAHILLSRRLRRVPAEEYRQAAAMLFEAHPEIIRIQAFVPAWHRAAIRLAAAIGGTVEGTLRGATLRGAKPADVVLIGMTQEEFYGRESRRGILIVAEPIDRDKLGDAGEYIRAWTDRPADTTGQEPVDGSGGEGRGHDVAGGAGAEERGGGHDQQNIGRSGGPGKPVPRRPRVRKIGNDGKGDTAGRTGTRERARRKRG
jgi:RimJ/RimL family protein N-acetyltransferase